MSLRLTKAPNATTQPGRLQCDTSAFPPTTNTPQSHNNDGVWLGPALTGWTHEYSSSPVVNRVRQRTHSGLYVDNTAAGLRWVCSPRCVACNSSVCCVLPAPTKDITWHSSPATAHNHSTTSTATGATDARPHTLKPTTKLCAAVHA